MKPKLAYDCSACPAYCCSIYERVEVTPSDVRRLAKHFGMTDEAASLRYTKLYGKERVLRRKKDPILGQACQFLNHETRGCGVYEARPGVCRDYPGQTRCSYYDVIRFERKVQDDPSIIPVVRLTFMSPPKRKEPPVKKVAAR